MGDSINMIHFPSRIRDFFISRSEMSQSISVDEVMPYGVTTFATWDYTITQDEAAVNRRFAISTIFKVCPESSTADDLDRRSFPSKKYKPCSRNYQDLTF